MVVVCGGDLRYRFVVLVWDLRSRFVVCGSSFYWWFIVVIHNHQKDKQPQPQYNAKNVKEG